MDDGIWATWYDLPEAGNDDYFAWLHGDYLPQLLQRPGYVWAAHYHITGGGARMQEIHDRLQRPQTEDVPAGSQYLVLVGAASPQVFFNPCAVSQQGQESGAAGEMLARRIGARECIFCEQARVNGPEYARSAPGTTTAPAIQMGSFRTASVADEYDLGRSPAGLSTPCSTNSPRWTPAGSISRTTSRWRWTTRSGPARSSVTRFTRRVRPVSATASGRR